MKLDTNKVVSALSRDNSNLRKFARQRYFRDLGSEIETGDINAIQLDVMNGTYRRSFNETSNSYWGPEMFLSHLVPFLPDYSDMNVINNVYGTDRELIPPIFTYALTNYISVSEYKANLEMLINDVKEHDELKMVLMTGGYGETFINKSKVLSELTADVFGDNFTEIDLDTIAPGQEAGYTVKTMAMTSDEAVGQDFKTITRVFMDFERELMITVSNNFDPDKAHILHLIRLGMLDKGTPAQKEHLMSLIQSERPFYMLSSESKEFLKLLNNTKEGLDELPKLDIEDSYGYLEVHASRLKEGALRNVEDQMRQERRRLEELDEAYKATERELKTIALRKLDILENTSEVEGLREMVNYMYEHDNIPNFFIKGKYMVIFIETYLDIFESDFYELAKKTYIRSESPGPNTLDRLNTLDHVFLHKEYRLKVYGKVYIDLETQEVTFQRIHNINRFEQEESEATINALTLLKKEKADGEGALFENLHLSIS